MRTVVTTVTIPLSGTVSAQVAVANVCQLGIWVPAVTSGQLLLRASYDTTSTNFLPLLTVNGSRWAANIGPGSATLILDQMAPLPWGNICLETSVPQAAARTFLLVSKP